MTQKMIALTLIFAMLAGCSTSGTRKVASVQSSEASSEFTSALSAATHGGDIDFEALLQKAVGAGWGFKDDPNFEGYKQASAPTSSGLPGELSEVQLLVKVTPTKEAGFEVAIITTTEELARDHKFLVTRTVKISPKQTDVTNRMLWEETIQNLSTSTVIAIEKMRAKDKKTSISMKRHTTKCLVATWGTASVLAVAAFIFIRTQQAASAKTAWGVVGISLFTIVIGEFGYVLADSICSGAPVPSM